MERCMVSGEEIVSNHRWIFRNPKKLYATCIRRIGRNILYAWVDSAKPVVLETFEGDLVKKVLEDSNLENKPAYLIWNLKHVKEITYAYKQGIVDFLYNPSPPLTCVVFYNTTQEFRNTAEIIQAILPSCLKVLFAENYNQAMRIILDVIGGRDPSSNTNDSGEYEELKKTFLATTARIGWLNMLNSSIPAPHSRHDLYPFFSALSFLQKDLIERTERYKKKKLQLESGQREKADMINSMISTIESDKKRLLSEFKKEKSALEETLSLRRNQYRAIETMLKSRKPELWKIMHNVANLAIDDRHKIQILDICEKLIESEKNQKKTNFPLTSTDSEFLSLLHKKHPNLNNRDIKVCLLIKLNYTTTEIASCYAISKRGMESLRYRLHKKMGLPKNLSLKNYLTALAEKLGNLLQLKTEPIHSIAVFSELRKK